jgi:hypothetical protein
MSYLDMQKRIYEHALQAITPRRQELLAALKHKVEAITSSWASEITGELPYSAPSTAALIEQFNIDLESALAMPFRVHVTPMQASNGLSYFVTLDRTDGDKTPTIRRDGRMTIINRNNVDEANAEGYAWAAFLGVPFEPCEAQIDTAVKNTVPQYGPIQAQKDPNDKEVKEGLGIYEQNQIVPIARPEANEYFVPDHIVPNRKVMVGDIEVETRPLAFGKKFSLLGISQSAELLNCGYADIEDRVVPRLRLSCVWLYLPHAQRVIKLEIPKADYDSFFVAGSSLHFGELSLCYSAYIQLAETVVVGLSVKGKINVELGDVLLEVEKPDFSPTLMPIKVINMLNGAYWLGYELDARRAGIKE